MPRILTRNNIKNGIYDYDDFTSLTYYTVNKPSHDNRLPPEHEDQLSDLFDNVEYDIFDHDFNRINDLDIVITDYVSNETDDKKRLCRSMVDPIGYGKFIKMQESSPCYAVYGKKEYGRFVVNYIKPYSTLSEEYKFVTSQDVTYCSDFINVMSLSYKKVPFDRKNSDKPYFIFDNNVTQEDSFATLKVLLKKVGKSRYDGEEYTNYQFATLHIKSDDEFYSFNFANSLEVGSLCVVDEFENTLKITEEHFKKIKKSIRDDLVVIDMGRDDLKDDDYSFILLDELYSFLESPIIK